MLNKIKTFFDAMIKPVRWSTFPRDFFRIQFGFALYGLSIALMIRGNLGTGAWSVLEVALSRILHLTPGTMTVISGFVVLSGALIMREQIGWGTIGNILSIGPWLDVFLYFIPSMKNDLLVQISMLLMAIFLMGNASAIYIGVGAGAGPRDSLMLALKRTRGISVRMARGIIEVTVFTLGWLLGGPAGLGSAVIAVLIGPSVQLGFKLYRVDPHKPVAVEAPGD